MLRVFSQFMENKKIEILEYHNWEYRPAVVCSIEEPRHPEGAYVQAYFITVHEEQWKLANGPQFVDILREGRLMNQADFEEMFGVIGSDLPGLVFQQM